jgi:4-aminobutyrate aminotransferase-like enzyme
MEMEYILMKTNESLVVERNKHIPQGPFNVHPIFVKKPMFVNSGAEAVENAIKIARHATNRLD